MHPNLPSRQPRRQVNTNFVDKTTKLVHFPPPQKKTCFTFADSRKSHWNRTIKLVSKRKKKCCNCHHVLKQSDGGNSPLLEQRHHRSGLQLTLFVLETFQTQNQIKSNYTSHRVSDWNLKMEFKVKPAQYYELSSTKAEKWVQLLRYCSTCLFTWCQ